MTQCCNRFAYYITTYPQADADVNKLSGDGESALHSAAYNGTVG
jgi:hypothetical protein